MQLQAAKLMNSLLGVNSCEAPHWRSAVKRTFKSTSPSFSCKWAWCSPAVDTHTFYIVFLINFLASPNHQTSADPEHVLTYNQTSRFCSEVPHTNFLSTWKDLTDLTIWQIQCERLMTEMQKNTLTIEWSSFLWSNSLSSLCHLNKTSETVFKYENKTLFYVKARTN